MTERGTIETRFPERGSDEFTEREFDTIGLVMQSVMDNPSAERRFNGLWLVRELERCGFVVTARGATDD